MLNRLLALALAGFLVGMVTPLPSSAQSETDARQIEKVKAQVTRMGTGTRARVKIKLKDGQTLKGYIGEIGEDGLTLVDARHGTITPVPYNKIEQVKSNNPSPFLPLALGVAAIGGVMLFVALALRGS
jgi:hypothetical protein